MKTTLVVMAAGIGSRYGAGIKQLAKMDENGYTIIDYSIYDAKEAGFDKVVFIIRPDIKEDFKEIIGDRISKIIVVDEPFLIINADDYYGKNVFKDFHKFLTDTNNQKKGKLQIAMAGYKLKNTLSDNGSVTRGVSVGNEDNKLVKIIETHEIALEKNGKISSKENLDSDLLNLETIVSMNMWATFPKFIDFCQEYFEKYLEKNKNNLEEAEYVLPEMIGEFLQEDIAQITILPTNDKWIGITYKEDLEPAQEEFKKMLINKDYPENIWK